MKISFYAPLKSPEHPVPSGDRQMARALIKALEFTGYEVDVVSNLRSFSTTPHNEEIRQLVINEAQNIVERWADSPPDLWFSYHPYYKAPDFLALEVLKSVAIPIVSAESSLAFKRDEDEWSDSQKDVRRLLRQAKASFYFTDRDLPGLMSEVSPDRLIHLPPFIDIAAKNQPRTGKNSPIQLVTMGMMRGGVKYESYAMLARALGRIAQADWHLTIIGDGDNRAGVEKLFGGFAVDKISWAGEVAPHEVPSLLAQGDVFVWPGYGEAYGLAYLEAQAAGLPVVAQNTHGVPFAVKDGETALLVTTDDDKAYAQAVLRLIEDRVLREKLGGNAARFVHQQRNLETASEILDKTIRRICT